MAGRLAQFLRRALPDARGVVAEGQSYLQALFETVANGRPCSDWVGGPLHRRPDGAPHPLDLLADALVLSHVEVDLLLLAGMAEGHEGLASILSALHPHGEPRVSVGLAVQLLCAGDQTRFLLRQLLECGTVVTSGVIRLTGNGPLFNRSLEPADALWSALQGIDAWPASIDRQGGRITLAGLGKWLASASQARAIEAMQRREFCTILVTADSEEVAFSRARALVQHAGLTSVGVRLPAAFDPEMERLIQVHALVRNRVPILQLARVDGPASPGVPTFEDYPHTVVICGAWGTTALGGTRPLMTVPVDRLTPVARQQMWRETIPALAEHAPFLAARYPVEPTAAAEVATDLQLLATLDHAVPSIEAVASSLRARSSLALSGGVKLIRPTATWDQLVLPRERETQLREAVNRLVLQARVFDEWGFLEGRHGARGVRLLFAGPPGTGKTLSAEVIANALAVDLLVIDISRVVSKWIGETEKNLAEVFDTAERAQAVLFFDEADALFGKRTEVSDAHDRYANLETAYLLARLERFEGLAVLATNLRQNIDPAFVRRLEFVVDFEDPDREQRHALWRCHIPSMELLADDVNLYELAALYPVVGGVIRNAAVAAGFLAATDNTSIHQRHFIRAIKREYDKAGQAFPGAPAGMTIS